MHYFLIGLPGSGKTTLGKQLAKKVNLPFLDTDKLIETQEGISIDQIFSTKGEAYFRTLETKVLHSLASEESSVISLGGGTPCFHNNMTLILSLGQSIFLDVSPETLSERLMGDGGAQRPMIKGKNAEDVLLFLKGKRIERIPFYQQANFTLQNDFVQLQDLLNILHR